MRLGLSQNEGESIVSEEFAYSWRVAIGGLGLFLAIVLATALRLGPEAPFAPFQLGESVGSSTAGSPDKALGGLPLAFERDAGLQGPRVDFVSRTPRARRSSGRAGPRSRSPTDVEPRH